MDIYTSTYITDKRAVSENTTLITHKGSLTYLVPLNLSLLTVAGGCQLPTRLSGNAKVMKIFVKQ